MLELLAQQEVSSSQATIDRLARTPLSQIIILVVVCSVVRFAMAPWLANRPLHLRSGLYSFGKFLNEFLDAVIYAAVFVFMVVRPFGVQTFTIPTGSMLETIQLSDFILANKAVYRYTNPKVGDIVVFRPPKYACEPSQIAADGTVNADFIKRLVGGPGDVVEIRNGTLYRNGKETNEPYLKSKPDWDFKLVKVDGVVKGDQPEFNDYPVSKSYWPLALQGEMVNLPYGRTAPPFVVQDTAMGDKLRELTPASIPPGYYLFMGDNRPGSFDGRAWGLVAESEIIGRAEFIWWPMARWRKLK